MKRTCTGLILAAVLFGAPAAFAQEGGVAFLGIGVDARSFALGDGGIAVASGASAAEWNPAGLAVTGPPALTLAHVRWIADQQTYGAAARLSLSQKWGGGAFVRATSTGKLEARVRPGNSDGTFDAQFVTAGAGLARAFGDVRVGATVRYVSERIFDVSSDGYAFDFGVQADLLRGGLQIGGVYQYLGQMERFGTRQSTLPETIRLGAAVHPFRILAWVDGSVIFNAYLTVDWTQNVVDDESQWHVGLSAAVLETVQARVGYVTNNDLMSLTAGLGVNLSPFNLDYAILPFDSGFGGPGHAFTLSYDL